jgi:thiosulfate/3-mercaptopyruvate sulfurtransferase
MLLSPAELESQLADPQLRVLDCSVHLESDGERAGHDIYQAGHVPRAAFMDVLADLSDPESDLDFTLLSFVIITSLPYAALLNARE